MEIKQEQNGTKGAFFVESEGERLGEMTYSIANNDLMIIDHTEVSERLKGLSMGVKLVTKGVEYARANNMKILPLCTFAKSVFDRKGDEFKDVLR